ncbi:MAG: D-cysteine desulfhydrase [Ignavibacteriae bacterium]|nr:MAG: D-cysteine desulfhydrase [Ignavibacteriota bacterium]
MTNIKKLNIANIPTPIQKVKFKGSEFLIKRDDFTGTELSGNKIRKLEYLLYDAKQQKSAYIFTCGGDQSNHARATAIAATSLGFKAKLFLWGNSNQKPAGNLFLDNLTGAEIKFLNKKEYSFVNNIMEEEQYQLKQKNINAYIIPTGGSSPPGVWGYINFVDELRKQIDMKKIKGIYLALGSGGTIAGLLVGQALLKENFKIFSVSVIEKSKEIKAYIENLCEETVKKYNLKIKVNYKNLEVLDTYSEEGYKKIVPQKVELIKEFFNSTGILFDPVYTGKAFYAYNENVLSKKKKSKIMFLHTGGLLGVFAKTKDYL